MRWSFGVLVCVASLNGCARGYIAAWHGGALPWIVCVRQHHPTDSTCAIQLDSTDIYTDVYEDIYMDTTHANMRTLDHTDAGTMPPYFHGITQSKAYASTHWWFWWDSNNLHTYFLIIIFCNLICKGRILCWDSWKICKMLSSCISI